MNNRIFSRGDVNTRAVADFIEVSRTQNINLRALQIYKKGEPVLKVCMAPYEFDDQMHLYSLSKSFTSVAVGICCDMGLLSPETVISELLADRMPENLSDDMKKIRLADLLSMQSGHNECKLYTMRWADDAVKAFFSQPLTYKPGEVFAYSTGSTCVCAACVERVTGKKIVDFLDEKLFSVLGIKKPRWRECRDGTTIGGTGLYLSSEDITKFGLMLYNKGVYNGKRIVSEEYLADATSRHSIDVNNGSPDWTAGYGYQFWRNTRGGFRGDGAFGQLLMVFPEEDIMLSYLGEVGNMAQEVKNVYVLLDNLFGGDENGVEALKNAVETDYIPAPSENFGGDESFTVGENRIGLNGIRLYGEKLLHVVLDTDYGVHEFVCGNGGFILNHMVLRHLNPAISFLDPDYASLERVSVYAVYEKDADGSVKITLRHQDSCHVQHWLVTDNKLTISLLCGDLLDKKFNLTPTVKE